jgi:hypothetical protein
VICAKATGGQATDLLLAARDIVRQVNPKRLGEIGREAFLDMAYAQGTGVVSFGTTSPQAEIPFVIEAWAQQLKDRNASATLLAAVNRTPVSGAISVSRDKRDIDFFGCGLEHTVAKASAGERFSLRFNITTPFMPITSDGKEPDFESFLDTLSTVVQKAVRRARNPSGVAKISMKDIVLENLEDTIAKISGDGAYRFGERQILYVVRKIVQDEIGQTLTTGNFKGIITDYEAEHGDIPGMYRDPRGSIYHPHLDETTTLGTLMVENYERPSWRFNKLVYIEKEGFSEALKDAGWAACQDCALLSSKGFFDQSGSRFDR